MVLRKLMGIFAITLIVCAASLATAGVPDVTQCTATSGHAGFAVLMSVPNGNGNPFTLASDGVGNVDATITVVVNDATPAPIANYPFEDIWLISVDGGMAACVGGATADASTDALGVTEFQTPLQAGGWSTSDSRVIINGNAIPGDVSLGHNSPDLDGSGAVNLTDVQIFAGDFFDVAYNFRSDLFFDAVVNLSDLPLLAAAVGATCP
ncbi:MAG: hypothetical protein ABFS42_00915 [Candidatus Krumholzibacteriota bacterium]